MVGDRHTDIELAHRLNISGILVKTGYGMGEIEHILPNKSVRPIHIAQDLFHAVRWIVEGRKALGEKKAQ